MCVCVLCVFVREREGGERESRAVELYISQQPRYVVCAWKAMCMVFSHCISTQENLLLDEQGNIKLIDFGLCGEPEVSAPCTWTNQDGRCGSGCVVVGVW